MPRLLASISDGTRACCSSSSLVGTIAYEAVRSIYNISNEMHGGSHQQYTKCTKRSFLLVGEWIKVERISVNRERRRTNVSAHAAERVL